MLIRPESPRDVDIIRALTAAAFARVHYSDGSQPSIIDRLRGDGDLHLSLVADSGGVVGHVAFSPVTLESPGRWFGLGPVAVSPDRQGRGIGQALISSGLDRLRREGAAGCVLIGDPRYYARFGFEPMPGLTFGGMDGTVVQGLAFGETKPRGEIRYPRAFG